MFQMIWERLMKILGREKTDGERKMWRDNANYAMQYEDKERINFTAIFAARLAALALSESTADVEGRGKRGELLEKCLKDIWREMKKITSNMLGTGGCIAVPYVRDGEISFDIISQDRLIIHNETGGRILSATVLADKISVDNREYFRWIHYHTEDNTLYITNEVTDENGCEAHIETETAETHAIGGVDRVWLAYFKSPVDGRRLQNEYGVPITYGCEGLIDEIYKCLEQIRDEYRFKEVKVFADERMFQKDPKTGRYRMPSKVFFASHGKETGNMIEVFSPDIRHESYESRLQQLFGLLEKSVGCSRGILTRAESRGATATEIKAEMYDTYALLTDIRAVIEDGVKTYLKICNKMANYYRLSPAGMYSLAFDWSYSMIESSAETWTQLKDAQSMGIKSRAELRQWLNPNERADEAEAAVSAISESM